MTTQEIILLLNRFGISENIRVVNFSADYFKTVTMGFQAVEVTTKDIKADINQIYAFEDFARYVKKHKKGLTIQANISYGITYFRIFNTSEYEEYQKTFNFQHEIIENFWNIAHCIGNSEAARLYEEHIYRFDVKTA